MFGAHNHHLEGLLDLLTADAYLKNKKGVYVDVNDVFLRVSATNTREEVIGKTDLDLIWHKQAANMMRNDQAIIHSTQKRIFIEPAQFPDGSIVHYLSHKAPAYNKNGKVIGIMGASFLIQNNDSLLSALKQTMPFFNHDTDDYDKIKKRAHYVNAHIHGLSKRQADCLYYLVQGMTMKQIASKLQLSPKTVEHYLEVIKDKWNCYSRSDLILAAFKKGFAEI